MPTLPHTPRRGALALLFSLCLAATGLLPAGPAAAAAADPGARAFEQAGQLVERMKAFDAQGVYDLTDVRFFTQQGIDLGKAREAVGTLNEQLQSIGAHYARFDLQAAEPFAGDGRLYVILPYVQVMEVKGRRIQAEAFFIGTSEDKGQNWKFVDGAGASDEGIRKIIPSYAGQPLPPRRQRSVQ